MNEEIEMIKTLIVVSGIMNMFLMFVMLGIVSNKVDNAQRMIKDSDEKVLKNLEILLNTIYRKVNKNDKN